MKHEEEKKATGPLLITKDGSFSDIASIRKYLANPSVDEKIFSSIQNLRISVEPIEKYREVKAKAAQEMHTLSPDILRQVMEKLKPFFRVLPTAHSAGHASRDAVHLIEILQDKEAENYDDVELLAGIIGGLAHDIANGVIDRTNEKSRLSYHDDVGAWLLKYILKDELPENLRLLVQFCVAAHTNTEETIEVSKDGVSFIKKPYETEIVGNDKVCLAITRAADRGDLNSIILPIRHLPYKLADNVPHTKIWKESANEREFMAKYLASGDQPRPVLKYFTSVVRNTKEKNHHSNDDTDYLMNTLFLPKVNDLENFIQVILTAKTVNNGSQSIKDFLKLSLLLEPGEDRYEILGKAARRLHLLEPDLLKSWAAGFQYLVKEAYPKEWKRMKENIEKKPAFAEHRGPVIKQVVSDLHSMANRVITAIDPMQLNNPPIEFPDILDTMLAFSN